MAANNYFNFTHSGTQYTATPGAAAAYQAQGGYAVAPTAASTPGATYTGQRAATGYEYAAGTTPYAAPAAASATTYDYTSYARSAAQAYDTSKTYYQQPVASAASYSTTDYSGWTQASSAQKPTPAVSAVYTYSQPGQRTTQPAKPAASALGAGGAAGYTAQTYGAPGAVGSGASAYATNTGTAGYGAVSQNKFTTPGSTQAASQLKKVVAPQTSYTGGAGALGYNSSYVTQAGGSYNYGGNKQAAAVSNVQTPKTTSLGAGVRTNVGGSNTGGAGSGSSYTSSYDQALYNAALYQTGATGGVSGGQNNKPAWKNYNKGSTGTGTNNSFNKFQRPKLPPKPQQIHYCEVCKISCAGPLTYKEHLEGSRHKKKEQAQKAAETGKEATGTKGSHGSGPHRGTSFKCDLCSVSCTGTDAYSAHLRGVKHQKVVKLHQKLGKPIPEPDPKATAILRAKAEALEAAKAVAAAGGGEAAAKVTKVTAAPKINFVSSGALNTTSKAADSAPSSTAASEKSNDDVDMIVDEHILPVGEEFVDEIKGEDGKLQTFHCKLCDCKFNDPNAKDMHMKGKRHRLAYKKKVDPTLIVEIKPNYFQKKQKEQRERMRMDYARRREEERANFWTDKLLDEERRYWEEMRRYEEEMEYYEWNMVAHSRRMGPGMPPPPPHAMPLPPGGPRPGMLPPHGLPPHMRGPPRMETFDDRHVIAKSIAISPSPAQLNDLSSCVDSVEKALKNVSDILVDAVIKAEAEKAAKVTGAAVKKEVVDEKKEAEEKKKDNLKTLKEKEEKRVLKGVNRVSALAKNILLKNEMEAELVVLCAEKPTLTLLRQVIQHLPEQLKLVAPSDTFDVEIKPSEAGFLVTRAAKPKPAAVESAANADAKPAGEAAEPVAANMPILINVVLTSPIIREEMLEKLAAKAKAEADAKKAATEGAAAATTPAAVVKQEPKEAVKPVKPEPKDLLSAQKCLDALANLRHAKWFQAKAEPLQSCQMVIRILRHMGQTWNLLSPWALELLVEKVLVSAGMPLAPGDALRRVLEAVSSGLLLQAGPGLMDPCEKDPIDALGNVPAQDREDLTVTAQIGLRQMAFHQVFKFLQMEPVKFKKGFGGGRHSANRKRRRDTSSGEKDENGIKKDKKEEEEAVKQETMETK